MLGWRDERESEGLLVCTDAEMKEALGAMHDLLNHPDLGEQTQRLLKNSVHQVFVIAEYHDEATGLVVPVKVLTDIMPNVDDPEFGKSLFDLKTARSAHPIAWKKAVFDGDLHMQAAMNLDCHNAVSGAPERLDFRHLIVENFTPWEPARRFITIEFVALGRLKYLMALKRYCECVANNYWPSYSDPNALKLLDGYEATAPEPWMIGK